MKRILLLGLLPLGLSVALAQAAGYGGNWTFTATGSDGTVLSQAATVQQVTRNGVTYLTAGGYTARLNGNVAALSLTLRDPDAVRNYSGTVRFSGNSASGSGVVREVYPNGEVQVTNFTLRGRR